ncbi:MAG: hypothetical protein E7262_05190 [Lachnospiraceae bacterium]|nr:hypothetical protein [Lachnospiraceae bacterium]
MKRIFKITGITATTLALLLMCLVGCNQKNEITQNETSEKPVVTDAPQEEAIPPVQKEDETIVEDKSSSSDSTTSKTDNTTNNDNFDEADDLLDTITDQDDKYDAYFKDHLNAAEYIVKKDGTYEFECEPSDNKAYWNIYVLDEPFEDAFRYLSAAYTPKIKATGESQELKLKKGQYVYGVCSENSFTDEGIDNNFSCPLSIELDD